MSQLQKTVVHETIDSCLGHFSVKLKMSGTISCGTGGLELCISAAVIDTNK